MSNEQILDFEKYFAEDFTEYDCVFYTSKHTLSDRVKIQNCDIATNFRTDCNAKLKLVLNNNINVDFNSIDSKTIIPIMCSPYSCLEIMSDEKCTITYDAYLYQDDEIKKNMMNKLITSSGLIFYNGVCNYIK